MLELKLVNYFELKFEITVSESESGLNFHVELVYRYLTETINLIRFNLSTSLFLPLLN